jgi:hypothetical protein
VWGLEGPYGFYNNTFTGCGTAIYQVDPPWEEGPVTVETHVYDNLFAQWTNYAIVLLGDNPGLDIHTNGFWNSSGYGTKYFGCTGANDIECDVSPFESAATGSYYLNNDEYGGDELDYVGKRTAATAGLDSDEFTYLPPEAYTTTTTFTENTNWNTAQVPDYTTNAQVTIGYHHNRIDYLIDDVVCSIGGSSTPVTLKMRASRWSPWPSKRSTRTAPAFTAMSRAAPRQWRRSLTPG